MQEMSLGHTTWLSCKIPVTDMSHETCTAVNLCVPITVAVCLPANSISIVFLTGCLKTPDDSHMIVRLFRQAQLAFSTLSFCAGWLRNECGRLLSECLQDQAEP